MSTISPITLRFLEAVKENNNKEWLHANRDLYQQEKERFLNLISSLLTQLKPSHPEFSDLEAKKCIFRFNKDVRFSHDKSPYKLHFGAVFAEGGRKSPLPCLYLHIQPGGNSGVAGGIWNPTPEMVNNIRLWNMKHYEKWKGIFQNSEFATAFSGLEEKEDVNLERRLKSKKGKEMVEQLAKIRGMKQKIAKQPEILEEMLYKRWTVWHSFSDEEVVKEEFEEKVLQYFELMREFNEFLNEGI